MVFPYPNKPASMFDWFNDIRDLPIMFFFKLNVLLRSSGHTEPYTEQTTGVSRHHSNVSHPVRPLC